MKRTTPIPRDLSPLPAVERLRSYIRDPQCMESAAQIKEDLAIVVAVVEERLKGGHE